MLVTFLADYRGIQTAEQYFQAGQQVELTTSQAEALAARGIVELVEVPEQVAAPPEPEPKPAPKKTAAPKKPATRRRRAKAS